MLKRLLLSLCALVVASSLWAYDFTALAPDGNTYMYTIIVDSDPLAVECYGASDLVSLAVTIPSTVTNNAISYSVTTIGMGAFAWSKISSVVIPESVTTISWFSFTSCEALTSVTIPPSVTSIAPSSFAACTALSELIYNAVNATVGQGWLCEYNNTELGTLYNYNLTKLSIGAGVQSIPDYFVSGQSNLTSVAIPSSVISIGANAFSGAGLTAVTIPASVTSIGASSFGNCTALTDLTYDAVNATVEKGWLSRCYNSNHEIAENFNLTNLTIGAGVQNIPDNFVEGQSKLGAVTIPASVISIGVDAFSGCSSLHTLTCLGQSTYSGKNILTRNHGLKTVNVPASFFNELYSTPSDFPSLLETINITNGELTSRGFDNIRLSYRTLKNIDMAAASNTALPDVALEHCYKMESVALPAGLETIGYKALSECVMLKSVAVPATVTTLGDRAFENCRRMDVLTFGSSLKASSALQTIGNWAFYNCHNLKSLVVPEGVTEIGLAAFYGCCYVEQLTLPSTMLKIGDNSFALCTSLKSITVLADAPPAIDAQTFYDVNRAIPVLVPEATSVLYAIDPYWSEFVEIAAVLDPTDPASVTGEVSDKPYRISVNNGVLSIDNPTDLPVSVFDMQGRLVSTSASLPVSGNVYVVKIGDHTETIY